MRIAVLLLLALATPAFADGVPTGLARAVRDYDTAQVAGDTATLDRLVTDDFVLVNSDGSVEDKRQFLADYHLPGFKIDPYVLAQRIEKVWDGGAVMGGLLRLSWTQDGRHQTRLLRIAYVWKKAGGRWRATYAQVTRVAS
jgi:ketosteroid isomerase-like protein